MSLLSIIVFIDLKSIPNISALYKRPFSLTLQSKRKIFSSKILFVFLFSSLLLELTPIKSEKSWSTIKGGRNSSFLIINGQIAGYNKIAINQYNYPSITYLIYDQL
jgi:hypothetical protein